MLYIICKFLQAAAPAHNTSTNMFCRDVTYEEDGIEERMLSVRLVWTSISIEHIVFALVVLIGPSSPHTASTQLQ